ncbi:MAG TPA: glycosyltransferase family 4 protein [Patescibacteria group bacterium]|nr:glycosyltransferase family 4 protein [Patescibacteria group bacterium]
MKVVFFLPYFYPHIGGVEKHSLEVARRLKRKGYKVIVVTEGNRDKKEKISGIEVYRLYFGKKNWFKKFRIWLKILKYRELIRSADTIHCHDVFFWYLPLRIMYPGKKVFITFHGFENIPPKIKEIFIRRLSEKLSSGNIAVGDYIKKWYGTNSNLVTYGAIDKIHKSTGSFNQRKPKILLIGRLESDIGIKSYIETLKTLSNFNLDVLGDGSFREELRKYGTVHGFVKNPDPYFKKADIIFASSYLSMLQGLSFRKPVFSIYENNFKRDYLLMSPLARFTVIKGSPKRLEDEVKLVMGDRILRESLILKSSEWIKNQTWDKITNQYLALWKLK